MKYDISFIVLNWHNEAETAECITSIKQLQGRYKKQIIIIDNESTAMSFTHLKKLKDITIVRNEKNLGFAGGVNSGLSTVDAPYIALINNDMVLGAGWLKAGLSVFQRHINVAAVGGKEYEWDATNNAYDTSNDYVSAPIINADFGFPKSTSRDLPEIEVSCLMGGNLLLNGKKMLDVGGFDEDFFAYCEETDLCLRFLARDWHLYYTPHMMVWHKRNLSSNRIPFLKIYLSQRNKLIYIAKHFEDGKWQKLIRASLLFNFVSAVLGNTAGLKQAFTIRSPSHIDFNTRGAYLSAVLWGLAHTRYLREKRTDNRLKNGYNNNLTQKLRLLQKNAS